MGVRWRARGARALGARPLCRVGVWVWVSVGKVVVVGVETEVGVAVAAVANGEVAAQEQQQ